MREPQVNGAAARSRAPGSIALRKAPTGIRGLDEITGGGLPQGRPTLVCGGAGCGKTLLAMEFLVRGAAEFGEPGVFVSFEETAGELATNVASLGFDVPDLVARGKLVVDHVHVERSEIEETGEYDLEGLFIRLGHAIDSVGARRVAMDTIESLFSGFTNTAALRAELRRLFRWLKDRGVTTVITGERGDGQLTRQGLEEYVSDCVILLDHRTVGQVSTRRLRVVKYRGTTHGTNEYPFLIDEHGLTVLPITSMGLSHEVSDERVSSGVARLDAMLGGRGFYRGSSVLVTGTAGSGKSSLSAHFADATCRRGERCLYFAFEESPGQILRNMASIGLELGPWVKKGLLRIMADRPTVHGLEAHLSIMHKAVDQMRPSAVIIDPVSALLAAGAAADATSMLLRMVDLLKGRGITALLTSLTGGGAAAEATDVGMSSMMDTWLLLRNLESNGERNRGLYVLKSRGMNHSNQIREFVLTSDGVQLLDVYVGPEGVLTGSARLAREAEDRAREVDRRADIDRRQLALERKRRAIEAQVAALRSEVEAEHAEIERLRAAEAARASGEQELRRRIGERRGVDREGGGRDGAVAGPRAGKQRAASAGGGR